MESWDVLIIGAGPAALRSAISCADEGITPLLIDSAGIGSPSGYAPISGLAASIDEVNSNSHTNDTIEFGGGNSNPESAARICAEGVPVLSELERWGLNFRRREGGLPLAYDSPGHSVPRLTGCGDSTVREITKLLEEQAIKRGIHRRADTLPLELVVDNYQVRGATVLNIQSGEIYTIQSKTVILATEGYQGLWSTIHDGDGAGLALATNCGIKLQGMQNIPKHPLTIRETNLHIPVDVLGSGARIRKETGEDVGFDEIFSGEPCVLDFRGIDNNSRTWFSQTASRIKNRMGLNIFQDVIPITFGVANTTGGIPSDESGRVIFDGHTPEGLPSKLWLTGLYSAGRCIFNGMHGDHILPGNLILDDLVSGREAGKNAASWSKTTDFGASNLLEKSEQKSSKKIEDLFSREEGITVGELYTKLTKIFSDLIGNLDSGRLKSANNSIKEIKNEKIRITDKSLAMNTELTSAIKLEGLISIAETICSSG